MLIEPLIRYNFEGKELSKEKLKYEVESKIGIMVVDSLKKQCPDMKHKDTIKLFDHLTRPEIRKILLHYLNVKIEVGEGVEVNVLDL